jgi:eukaryotic-like serine/threonine-protein kinase
MSVRAERVPSMPVDVQLPERYRLVRRVASGGFASVWCAEDEVLGRRVAIKLLAAPYAHDEHAVRRFKREARTAAQLSGHPHVVTIFDVGQAAGTGLSPGRAFIVMEYLPGGTVADALRVGAVSQAEALRWLREAASALDHAHSRGVVHRDIKPANLLLDCARVLHVADFGIAHVSTDQTITHDGQVLGTAAYLAPERALGRPATEASDRYSLAVAAFELLTGTRPFPARQFAALARQHLEMDPPSARTYDPTLPAAVDAVLARGMAKRPEDRWPTARAFAGALEEAVNGVAAERTSRIHPVARRSVRRPAPPALLQPRRRVRTRAFAVGALVAGVLLIAALALAGNGGPTGIRNASRSHSATIATKPAARPAAAAPVARATHPKRRAQTSTQQLAAATTPAASADALEAQGHALMVAGNYGAAIPVLRHALAEASPQSDTYAYALFDLGKSYLQAGDPRAAVPILYQRLQIPNQTDVVRAELQLALEQLGQQSGGPAGSGKHDRGKGNGKAD